MRDQKGSPVKLTIRDMGVIVAAIAIGLAAARMRTVWWVWKPYVFNSGDIRWLAEILIAYGNCIKFVCVRLAPSMVAQSFAVGIVAMMHSGTATSRKLHYGISGNIIACISWGLVGLVFLISSAVVLVESGVHATHLLNSQRLWNSTVMESINVIGSLVTGWVILSEWSLRSIRKIPKASISGYEAWGLTISVYWVVTSMLISSTLVVKLIKGPEAWYPLNVGF